ncbi:hypothetical protein QL285_053428 [Trifolium repens]|nr:hypothetical protein QL285_053428 [Trifolium repens]
MILKQDPSTSAMILLSFSSNLHRSSVLDTKILTHILSSPKNPNLSPELQLSFYRPLKQRRSRGYSLRARYASRTRSLTFPVQNVRAIFARTSPQVRLREFSRGFLPSQYQAFAHANSSSLAQIFQRDFCLSRHQDFAHASLSFACANFNHNT